MISTIILTGASNHDWQKSSAYIKALLERSGKFSVTIVANATEFLEKNPGLPGTQLLFIDGNGPEFIASPTARRHLEQAVASGVNAVFLHSSNNLPEDWLEMEKICGRVFRPGSGHGEYKQSKVVIRDREHDITRNLPDFLQWDEFYFGLVDKHQIPIHVLATVYSDPDPQHFLKGSGKDEPMAFTLNYGKGRVYHHVLGHVAASEVYPGYIGCTLISFIREEFQRLLINGCEWAATGAVTPLKEETFTRPPSVAFQTVFRE